MTVKLQEHKQENNIVYNENAGFALGVNPIFSIYTKGTRMPYPYEIIRSNRTTLGLEVNTKLEVIVRAPKHMPTHMIANFVMQHEKWIDKAMEKQKNKTPLPSEDSESLRKKAKAYLPGRVAFYSQIMGLSPTRITITGAKTRFGSCSPKNSLSFSYYLMLYPPEAIDYVVVHELAHIRHHNHGKQFWALVEKYMPDYRERKKQLK